MKKLLLSAFILSCCASFGQWAGTTNNSSNDVTYAFGKAFASDGMISNTNGLQVSTDNGANWTSSNTGVPSTGVVFGTYDGSNLYAFRNNTVFASGTGNNWMIQPSTMSASLIIKSMTVLNGSVIASASPNSPVSFKIYQLSSGTWGLKSSPTNSATVSCIRNLGGTLYAGTTNTSVLKSTDAGMTWTGGLAGMPTQNCHKYIQCLANSGSTLYCGTIGGRIVRSTDNGANWASVYNIGDDNGFYSINDFYVHNSTTVFAATDSGFVYTTNGGNTWTRYNAGLNFGNFENLMKRVTVSGSYIIAGVNTSAAARVVRVPLSAIGLTPNTGITSNTMIFENSVYPNPATDKITIEISDLIFENNCEVSIYDAMGKLVEKTIMMSGKAEVNLENYNRGLYTFTVSQDNSIVSRGKLIRN